MRRTIVIIILIILPFLHASIKDQTNWSEGPGTQGPVASFSGRFWESDGIRWSYPGVLRLEDNYPYNVIDSTYSNANEVICFDIDMDGDDDLIGVPAGGNEMAWWENLDSTPTSFAKHIISDDYLYPSGVYPVDIDGDGDIDMAGCSYSYNEDAIVWWENLNEVELRWQEHVIESTFQTPGHVAAADIDGDGDADVVVAGSFMNGNVYWWENVDGQGNSWIKQPVVYNSQNSTNSIDIADIDNDRVLDIFWVHYNSGKVYWLENPNSAGDLWPEHLMGIVYHPRFIQAADLDNDNDFDAVVVCQNKIYWYENINNASYWSRHTIGSVGTGTSAHAVDMDGDSYLDVLSSSYYSDRIRCWLNPYPIGTTWTYRDLDNNFNEPYSVSAGDLNNDGHPDVAGASSGDDTIAWWDYNGYSYANAGELTSSILTLGNDPGWDEIDWNVSILRETEFLVLVRASDDPNSMGAWSDTLHTPCSLEGILEENASLFQYKVILTTDNSRITPVLEDITVNWTPVSIEPHNSRIPPGQGLLPFSPNPMTGPIRMEFNFSKETLASVSIYDIMGRCILDFPPAIYETGTFMINDGSLVPGVYYCRMISDGYTMQQSFVVVE